MAWTLLTATSTEPSRINWKPTPTWPWLVSSSPYWCVAVRVVLHCLPAFENHPIAAIRFHRNSRSLDCHCSPSKVDQSTAG